MRKALILYTRAEFLSWCRTLGGGGGGGGEEAIDI